MTPAELRAAAKRIRERPHADADDQAGAAALDALATISGMLPGPRSFAQSLSRDINGQLFPRLIDADRISAAIITTQLQGRP